MQRIRIRSVRAIALSSAILWSTTGCAATAQQTQMVPAQAQVLPAPEPVVLPEPEAPPSRLVPVNRPQPSTRAAVRRGSPPLATIRSANDLSRQTPAPDGFINSAMFYDYMPGAIYEVHTSPRFISTIALRPGEKLISKAAGDTVRWVMGETQQGTGSSAQTLVFIKPIKGELRTNIVLTTDQRTYMLEAISHASDAYTSIVSWNYPRDQLAELTTAGILANASSGATIDGDISVDNLNFGYRIRARGRHAPAWTPERVFDDGSKTYIQFAPDLGTTEAPPLFVIGENKQAELVNYRVQGRYYVIDRLISVAELRLGSKKQEVVRIERQRDGRS
nr:P-type conjugative transfer protein TrbG [Sphingomonas sp. CDS-1]